MTDFSLKKTVRAAGKDHTVPIAYEREGVYHVFTCPKYGVEVKHRDRGEAFRQLEIDLILAIEEFVKSRL